MSYTGDGFRKIRSTWFGLTQEQKNLAVQYSCGDLMMAIAIIGMFGWWGLLFLVGYLMSEKGLSS